MSAVSQLTDEVQAAVHDGDWQRASELEALRLRALEGLLAMRPTDPVELQQFLTSTRDSVNHLIGEVHHHQRRIVREATMIRTGRKAKVEYESAAKRR